MKGNLDPHGDSGIGLIALIFLLLLFSLMGVMAGYIKVCIDQLPDLGDIEKNAPSHSSAIYDSNRELICSINGGESQFVPLSRIPKYLQDAFIASEDSRFWDHWGIDPYGIGRALIVGMMKGRISQGASTITQQLARELFLSKRKSIERKIKEILLAIKMERKLTKPRILELYLNRIYLGHGAYGVQAASKKYFGKDVWDLTLPEAAMIAALPPAPNEISPFFHPDVAVRRRNKVLERMAEQGYITREEAERAKEEPLNVKNNKGTRRSTVRIAPYFVEYVKGQILSLYGPDILYKERVRIYTSLDLKLQEIAEDAVEKGLERLDRKLRRGKLQAALVAIDAKTGQIKAMVGGRDFSKSQFNRAVQARRQPGSAFKPFIYTAAIDSGISPYNTILDEPITFRDSSGRIWSPHNYDMRYRGRVRVKDALAFSLNVATVRLLLKVGVEKVIDYAKKMGIKSPLRPDLSLALGTSEVTPLELAAAYSVFANEGIYTEPTAITEIRDESGDTLELPQPRRYIALKKDTAKTMASLLSEVVERGTGRPIRSLGFDLPAAGKTGTTEDTRDAWFVGFSEGLVTCVWVGYDNPRPTRLTGATGAIPIWTDFMKRACQKIASGHRTSMNEHSR